MTFWVAVGALRARLEPTPAGAVASKGEVFLEEQAVSSLVLGFRRVAAKGVTTRWEALSSRTSRVQSCR